MRRASAQAWLASARSQPPLSQLSAPFGVRSAALLTCARPRHSAGLLSPARPNLRTTFTTTAASTTLRRLGLSGVAQPLRAGLRSKTLPGGRRNYSTEAPSAAETAKAADTPASLAVLRAEFYMFESQLLNWNIEGVKVPEAVLWLALFQFLSGHCRDSFEQQSVRFVRWYVERLKSLGLPLGGDDDDNPQQSVQPDSATWFITSMAHFASVNGTHTEERDLVIIHRVAFLATLSVIAFFWARGRTRNSFDQFVYSRASGHTAGTYPITKANYASHGDMFMIKGEGLKSVRREVSRRAGLKAVLASAGLLLASTATSHALTTWVDAKMKDGVIKFRRSDMLRAETALSILTLLFTFVGWAVLVYQPYTIFPYYISNLLMSYLGFKTSYYKRITPPEEKPVVVAEREEVVEADGGKEYITVTEEKSGGSDHTRTETHVLVSRDDADAQLSLGTTTKTDA